MKKYLNKREWFNLLIIAFFSTVSIFPGMYYLAYGDIPDLLLSESGIYESAGAAACFIAGLINLGSFKRLLKKGWNPGSLWILLLAVTCLFIAGEEISWGQHFFDYKVPDSIASTNFQMEFNLHNSTLIQSSNNSMSSLFFRFLMLFFIALPMFLVAFPTLDYWARRMMLPVPSMLVAIIALFAKVGDLANYRIVYGRSFQTDSFRVGEGVESVFELCLLVFSLEIFFYVRNTTRQCYTARS